ncbi:MAG TPA: hypothetical protein VIP05_05335, partial [Burkholderiaceae bacterium]
RRDGPGRRDERLLRQLPGTRADVVKQRRARLRTREGEGRASQGGSQDNRGERALSTSWKVHWLTSW